MAEQSREMNGSDKLGSSVTSSTVPSSPAVTARSEMEDTNFSLARGDQNITAEGDTSHGRFWPREGRGDEPDVLEPDNPLMKRFQASLRVHLERQNSRLAEEVTELEANLKQKQFEREEVGLSLYNIQQEVAKQQSVLESYHNSLATFMKMRQDMEDTVYSSRGRLKAEQERLNNAWKKEGELRCELESLTMLERQFTDWEQEMESELVISQRVSEKTKLNKRELAEEKRKQDVLLYKLMTEVANLEEKLVLLDGQFRLKEAERSVVGQTVADANADLECLRKEQQRLMQAWNTVVVNMQQRDKVYAGVVKDYNSIQEHFVTLNHEIDGIKKSSHQEMETNEKWTMILGKVQFEMSGLERQFTIDSEKRNNLEVQVSSAVAMLEQTVQDLEKATLENHRHTHVSSLVARDVQKLLEEKLHIEDAIVTNLQEQIAQNKAAQYMSKMVQQLRDKTRDQELTMVNTENQYSQVLLDTERAKGDAFRNQLLLDEMNKEISIQENEVAGIAKDLDKSQFLVCKKQGLVDSLNKKLEKITIISGDEALTPMELKIVGLQKTISDMEENTEKLQQFWMRQQEHIVNLRHRRNEQLQEMDIQRKQILLLNTKNLRMEREIERHKSDECDLNRSIKNLLHRIEVLNSQLCQQRGHKDTLDRENSVTQTEYISRLKEAEMKSLKLQTEISDLEEEKVQLGETFLAAQQENLAWEKKLQMALETKQNIEKERGKEGEVGAMKTEIHRMQVRYSQLRRAQERLVQDLEHCVSRRDAIVDMADAREKRSSKGVHNTHVSFKKKLEDLRNKIKHTNNETKTTEQIIADMEARQQELLEQVSEKQEQLRRLDETAGDVDKQLEEGQLHKQQKLELLVRRQRKVRLFGEVKTGRYRLLFRNEQALAPEMQRQKTMNADLIGVLEALLIDFPSLQFMLKRILNTLRSQPA